MFTAFTGRHLGRIGRFFTNCKIYIISHSGLWKINLDEGSIFIKSQGKKLFKKNYLNTLLI